MIQVKRFRHISQIDAHLWDSILSPRDIFNTHRFISVVEKSKVENASFWYLLFYQESELVGHAVLSSFSFSLDLFITESRLAVWTRKFFPDLFRVRILFCGLPASFGQLNLKVANVDFDAEICQHLSDEMEQLAATEKINLLCTKEFKPDEVDRGHYFLAKDYFKAFSIPYMEFDVEWKSFQDYLSQLRHPYRRAIRLSLKKFGVETPVIFASGSVPSAHLGPVLILGNQAVCSARQIFELYLSVMDRTPTKLEVLNQSFFEELYSQFGSALEILAVQHHGKIISVALLVQVQHELTFMLVGRECAKDKFDSYFNLMYGIIHLGITRNVRRIHMGQTAYWVKQRVGAQPVSRYIYFKSRNSMMNAVLKKFNRLIFPELQLKPIRIANHHSRVNSKGTIATA